MTEATPSVRDDTLVWLLGDEEHLVPVGSPAWQTWLLTATKFTFSSAQGSYTAYKEPRQRGGLYWKAYRRRGGKRHRAYLGKDEQLSVQRLNEVAANLAADGRHLVGAPLPEHPVAKKSTAHSEWSPVGSPSPDRQDLLLWTKLSPSPVGPDLLERPRLTQRLSAGLKRSLTMVVAPAGFGKTSLLGQWLRQERCPIAWLSLDAGDNESARFWRLVIAALQTERPRLGDAALTLLRSLNAPPTRSVLTVLSNEITAAAEDIAIVLDDFHFIEDQSICSGISFLLDCAPLLHLVIASRSTPPLPLGRLRGRGQLVEVADDDLRFTPEETTTFLNDFRGLRLSAEDVAALEKRSEGWIVMLHLAALSMQGRDDPGDVIKSFAGDNRYVMDFLIEEVLARQPEDVQAFLQQTSILHRLSGSLCEAVTGLRDGEGQAMLGALERAHLLTLPVDSERGWYRYHALLTSALSSRLHETQPVLVPELHRRAYRWYAERKLAMEAIDHALMAGEVEAAASLIEQTAPTMYGQGEMATILGWLRSLPDEAVRARPLLCILDARALLGTGQPELAEARLRDAETLIRLAGEGASGTTIGDRSLAERKHHTDIVLALRAIIAAGRREILSKGETSGKAVERFFREDGQVLHQRLWTLDSPYPLNADLARTSEALVNAALAGHTSGMAFVEVMALTQLGFVQATQGQLRRAETTFQQALARGEEHAGRLLPPAASPCFGLAMLHLEWSNMSSATRYAMAGVDLAGRGGNLYLQMSGQGVLVRLKLAEGDVDGALELLHHSEQMAQAMNLAGELDRIAAYRARLWLAKGDVKAALGWARTCGLSADDEPSGALEALHLTLARVLLAAGEPAKAFPLLERLLDAATSAGRMGSAIKVSALCAVALHALGKTPESLTSLKRALSAAEPERYFRSFIDLGVPMVALLSGLADAQQSGRASEVSPSYIQSLLGAFGSCHGRRRPAGDGTAPGPARSESLSEREIQVLRLIAAGWSASQIARELVVSHNTIKTHYKNIYGRLGAHTRAAVIAKAKAWRLV